MRVQSARGGHGQGWISPSRVLMLFVFVSLGFWIFVSVHHRESIQSAANSATHTGLVTVAAPERQLQADSPPPGDPCDEANWFKSTELHGAVVVSGQVHGQGLGLHFPTGAECCRECQKTRGCNRWVYCQMKSTGDPEDDPSPSAGMSAVWQSGVIYKDFDVDPATVPLNASISHIVLHTGYGAIRILLKPEWSQSSVDFLRRLASKPELCTRQCQFYRAEPGFLLQGSLRAYIPANTETKPGPKIMERGEIGWAGGGAGPDFFIYLGTQPATHFGTSHTVWGVVADEQSLALVEKIVQLPATAERPGAMHMLDQTVGFYTSAE